jgi:uncharacterized protein
MVRHLRRLFERAAVLQVSGDARRPERVVAGARNDVGGFGAPPNHRIGVRLGQGSAGQLAGRAAVGLEQHRLQIVREARAGKIFMQVGFEIVMGRHGVLLAALLLQAHPEPRVHRYAIVAGTLLVALAGTPLLRHLHFDFNPLNLRSPKVESVATLLDLMKDPNTDTNTIDVLVPSLAEAPPLMARLQQLPEVARVTSLESFIPQDQDEKLAIIAPVASSLLPLLDPAREKEPPTDAEDVEALEGGAAAFKATADGLAGKGADDARRLAKALENLAAAAPPLREAAREALIPSLDTMLDLLRASLTAKKVTVASIPPDLARNWVSADGRARIEVAPAGDRNDNATLARFANAVRTIDPNAMGEPIAVLEAGNTVVRAFFEAGLWALISISVLSSSCCAG